MFETFVLSGGKSRRMGEIKGLLKIVGKTLIERAAESLEKVFQTKTNLVFADAAQSSDFMGILPASPRIFDVYKDCGALSAVHAALLQTKAKQQKWAIIAACDIPLINRDLLKKIKTAAIENPDSDAIIPRENHEKLQFLCAAYRVENCLTAAMRLLQVHAQTSDNRAPAMHDFVDNIKFIALDLPLSENVFFNVNTPADYQYAKKIIESS